MASCERPCQNGQVMESVGAKVHTLQRKGRGRCLGPGWESADFCIFESFWPEEASVTELLSAPPPAVFMRRCGCNVSCPSWPPTWRGRWEVFSQWFVTKAWPFCRRWSWVLVVAALIGLGFWLPTTTKFKSVLAWIRNLDTIYAVLAFVSIQTLLTVLFLPGALFVLMAGYTLDFWIGTLVAWTGSVLGALGAFIIGRQRTFLAHKAHFLETRPNTKIFAIWRQYPNHLEISLFEIAHTKVEFLYLATATKVLFTNHRHSLDFQMA